MVPHKRASTFRFRNTKAPAHSGNAPRKPANDGTVSGKGKEEPLHMPNNDALVNNSEPSPRQTVALKGGEVTEISGDRRSRRRYAVDLPLQYKVMNHYRVCQAGSGKTVNMSSRGIAFETGDLLKMGAFVELAITWPVLLNQSCPLKLVVTGRVVRTGVGLMAIRMERYEFKTQGSRAFQAMVDQTLAAGLQV